MPVSVGASDERDSRMRVGWVLSGNEQYGTARSVRSVVAEVRRRGWSPWAVALAPGPFARELRRDGVAVDVLDGAPVASVNPGFGMVGSAAAVLRSYLQVRDRLAQVARGRAPTALVIVQWATLLPHAGLVARESEAGAVWEMPGIVGQRRWPWSNQLAYQVALRRTGVRPIANSAHTASSLHRWGPTPAVSHLGVDPEAFSPDAPRMDATSLGLDPDVATFGIVARLVPTKGQLVLAESLCRVARSRREPLQLVVVGGPLDGVVANRLREIGREALLDVVLTGPMADPAPAYGAVHVGVNMRLDAEPFGLSVIESMLEERPVLVHALGGPAETVIDGETGWHVHSTDAASLDGVVQRVLEDRPRWQEMGRSARRRALAEFTPARHLDRLLAFGAGQGVAVDAPPAA